MTTVSLLFCCCFYVTVLDQVVSVTFELGQYDAAEGQPSVEVCAVTDLTPAPGQTVSVLVSTEDGTASGKLSVYMLGPITPSS